MGGVLCIPVSKAIFFGWINCRFIVFEDIVHKTNLHFLADFM